MELTNPNLTTVTIYSDETSNPAISHKPPVKSYASKVFQECTIGIVSSIFTTKSKYRRLFKVLISSLCIAGFIYNCVTFLDHVFEYPEVVGISLNRSDTYNWPAITYCNNNPIRRSVFCKMYPQHCVKPSEEFCKKFSPYCGDDINATLVPKKKFYQALPDGFQFDWILNLGSIPNIFGQRGDLNKTIYRQRSGRQIYNDDYDPVEISGPYLRSAAYSEKPISCYSMQSVVESNKLPIQKKRNEFSAGYPDHFMTFYVEETEMMNPRSEPGVYFYVHSPFEADNPLRKGFFFKGGHTYVLHVEMEEEVRLKEPFESNCVDYDERWKKNNRTGPRTKKMCNEKCDLEKQMRDLQCVFVSNLYPHKERLCGDEYPSNYTISTFSNAKSWIILHSCREKCRDECRSLKYRVEVSKQEQVNYLQYEEVHRIIEVIIFLSNDEVKVLRHSPKYETVDVISSVGGFMGCWLGIALLDLLDVFGSVITVCRYALKKKSYKENEKAYPCEVKSMST